MPVYALSAKLAFPSPDYAEPGGLLAVGGDLSVERLLLAYRMGIFPWYAEGDPILWWSPDPRLVLFPEHLRVAKSLHRVIGRGTYSVSVDRAFEQVIRGCATVPRRYGEGTWIVPEMQRAYVALHRAGYAHSVETWSGGQLAGGLYGVSLGRAFFGESMFSLQRDASKVALAHLAGLLRARRFAFIDCQVPSQHLARLGAQALPRSRFLGLLASALGAPAGQDMWNEMSRAAPLCRA
jgi:leucyl/phenylalanyl-tRNA--protein transferase